MTIGAILGMAAHLEGKGCGSIDMAGLAQKGGAVYSHVKIAARPEDVHAIRVAAGEADLVLGCDLVVSGTKKVLAAMRKDETGVVVNTAEIFPGDFTHNPDFSIPSERIKRAIRQVAGEGVNFIDATGVATALLGNSIAANMFMLGFAWQKGLVPLEEESILHAIELNGQSVEMNQAAFLWGRREAANSAAVEAIAAPLRRSTAVQRQSQTLNELIERRVGFLTAYQNKAYAERYAVLVKQGAGSRADENARACRYSRRRSRAIISNCWRSRTNMKSPGFTATDRLQNRSQRHSKVSRISNFISRRPFLAVKTPRASRSNPRWALGSCRVFRGLAALKPLRGTMFDVFGYSQERRTERKLIADYETMIEEILTNLSPRQLRNRGRAGLDPGKNPRLRSCQDAPFEGGQGGGEQAPRAVPRRPRTE